MKYIFALSTALILFSCSKEEDNVIPPTTQPQPIVETNNPSPCTNSLTDNQVESSPNVFPLATVAVTSTLSNNSMRIDGNVPGFNQGGDIDIRFGTEITSGIYTIVDNSSPSTTQATISMTPNICSICPFKATSGNLYITETPTQWIAEWCDVNFNSITVNPNSTVSGRIITDK